MLLINTSVARAYAGTKIETAIPHLPPLSLGALAAPLVREGHEVNVLDLNLEGDIEKAVEKKIEDFSPDFVGISFTTPTFDQTRLISGIIKKTDKDIITIGGGPHASYNPYETLKESTLDMVIVGEGDFRLTDIVSGKKLNLIDGVFFKRRKKIFGTAKRVYIENLDDLPFPLWDIFDIKKYRSPRIVSRKNPVAPTETSRGCVFGCTYCTKNVFGRLFRAKSAKRVVDEIEYILENGFNEIHVLDDGFSTDMKRAKKICDMIKGRDIDLTWNLRNGIRVDRVDKELMEKICSTGCYRLSFGVESGNQKILNNIKKGITLETVRKTFRLVKNFDIETMAFFMFALPGDTEKTMRDTINFAKELDPDVAKASICTPFPGTPLFEELDRKGLIKTKDWSKYITHNPREVFTHTNLDWDTIYEYYNRFYKEFYLRPKFTIKKLKSSIRDGTVIDDFLMFIKTKW